MKTHRRYNLRRRMRRGWPTLPHGLRWQSPYHRLAQSRMRCGAYLPSSASARMVPNRPPQQGSEAVTLRRLRNDRRSRPHGGESAHSACGALAPGYAEPVRCLNLNRSAAESAP